MSTSPRLVLWDIDHTLISTGGVGSEVFRRAFREATGAELAVMPDPTGKTEPATFARALRENMVPVRDELFSAFAEAQTRAYREQAAELAERGRVLPGVREVLEELAGRPDVLSSVLSGNTRAAGRAKLEAFGLARYLDWDIAAGGDDAPTRPDLVPVAWERAAATYGYRYGLGETVLVGDTLADIATAHANRCRVLAVATGRTSFDELVAGHADLVLIDLSDTSAVLAALLGY